MTELNFSLDLGIGMNRLRKMLDWLKNYLADGNFLLRLSYFKLLFSMF